MIRWITAFLDSPAEQHHARAAFWCAVTGSTLSATRGDTSEFATVVPPDGDAYLRTQCTDVGAPRIHIDLHVEDPTAILEHAIALGATLQADRGYKVLASPGGLTCCVVNWHGERTRPQPFGNPPSLLDQVCLDIPPALYEVECEFWAQLTGWELVAASRPEFCVLVGPEGMPLRLLLQRLDDAAVADVCAHIDVATGQQRREVVMQHLALGAQIRHEGARWTTLLDPAGEPYCLTDRDPFTGIIGS